MDRRRFGAIWLVCLPAVIAAPLLAQRAEPQAANGDASGRRPEIRSQRSEVRGQGSEVRGQRSEVRGQTPKARGQRPAGKHGPLTTHYSPLTTRHSPAEPGRRTIDIRPRNPRSFIGIMGPVARPGVYEFSTPYPLVTEAIERAGGLTEQAIGSMRIIRDGRPGPEPFYSPHLQLELLPGDLIVVEGRPEPGSVIHPVAHQGPAHGGLSRIVQVAFLNLLDRPVVAWVREENATVPRLVSLLRQRREVASQVRIIPSCAAPCTAKEFQSGDKELPDGSVLIFDPDMIEEHTIPTTLPKPHPDPEIEIQIKSEPSQDPAEGVRPQVPDPSSPSEARRRERESVEALLQAAREDLRQGRLEAAREKALLAREANVEYHLWDDRPDLVLEEIEKLASKPEPQLAPQPMPYGPAADRPQGGPLQPRSIERIVPPAPAEFPPADEPPPPEIRAADEPPPIEIRAIDEPAPVNAPVLVLPPPPVESAVPRQSGAARRSTDARVEWALAAEEIRGSQHSGPEALRTEADANRPVEPAAPPASIGPAPTRAVVPTIGRAENAIPPMAIIAIGALVPLVGGIAVWWLRRRLAAPAWRRSTAGMAVEPQPADNSPVPEPRGGTSPRLDVLIMDELPLIEEPVRLPAMLTFYGRPVGPLRMRLDGPHETRRPHFRPRTPRPEPVTAAADMPASSHRPAAAAPHTNGQGPSGPEPAAKEPPGHKNGKHPSAHRPGVLDRILETVHNQAQ